MVDAHTWWRMGDRKLRNPTVEQLAEEMAAYDIAWLEEPLPPDDHEAYRQPEGKTSCRLPAESTSPTKTAFST